MGHFRPVNAALLLSVLVLGACGGMSRQLDGTYVEFAAPSESASHYDTADVSGDAIRAEPSVQGWLSEAANAALSAPADDVLTDARLGTLAHWALSEGNEEGRCPPSQAIRFYAVHLGLLESEVECLWVASSRDSARQQVGDALASALSGQRYNRFGAAARTRDGEFQGTILLTYRALELERFPASMQMSQPVVLRGRLLGELRNPELTIMLPGDRVRHIPGGSGPEFQMQVPTQMSGIYRIEVSARGRAGVSVIARFPVYVGREPERRLRISTAQQQAQRDVAQLRIEMLQAVNRLREEAGLAPLQIHAELERVAQTHSEEMVERDVLAHRSARSGLVVDRVRRARLSTRLVLENIGRGQSVSEVMTEFLQSPGYRANLMNPDVRQIGIGLVPQSTDGRTVFWVTQVLGRLAEQVNLRQADERLLNLINRNRRARGVPPLTLETHFSEAAQEASEAFFADSEMTEEDALDDATSRLRGFAIAYRRVASVMAVVGDLHEAIRLEPLFDPEVRYLGVGATQGTREDTGPNAVGVIFVLGWPR